MTDDTKLCPECKEKRPLSWFRQAGQTVNQCLFCWTKAARAEVNGMRSRARATDPETSHEAAAKVRTGTRAWQALHSLRRLGKPATFFTVGLDCGIPVQNISPVFVRLEQARLVRVVGTELAEDTKRRRRLFELTELGQQVLQTV